VSRELLQQNPELETMRGALTRRVLDMLTKLATSEEDDDLESYRKFWREFGSVIKEGVVEDAQNADKVMKLLRFASTRDDSDAQSVSLSEYLARAPESQDRIYYLLADSIATARSSPHLEKLREKGIEVLLLTDRIDPWMADHLTEFEGKAFQDVGRGQVPLPEGDGEIAQDALNEEHKPLLKKIRRILKDRVETVNVSQRLVDSPACIVTGEQDLAPQLRRMLEAAGQKVPDSKPVLEINIAHPLVERLSAETDDVRFEALSNIVLDHAMLAEGEQLHNPAEYVRRMNQLLLDLGGKPG
jgi:molecular chaperone HtpG